MGGSRCTYRNCSVRSDGVVHMFHYPVYDKVRCHQWLVNAHRFDFLNLKLSQVRNRVICQHHFKEECFMNYLKDKLTFDAIPTDDGPYCVTSKDKVLPVEQIAKTYSSVALNDVDEVDKYSKMNVKPSSSMIYADFLTNGDVWEKQSLNETIWNNMVVTTKETPNEDNISVVWQNVDGTQGKQKIQEPMITLTELVEDINNTKITEFENPLLASMSQNKVMQKSHGKKPQKGSEHIVKHDSSSLLSNQSTSNVVTNVRNQEPILTLSSFIRDSGNTKITEFEVPVTEKITINKTKGNANQKSGKNCYKVNKKYPKPIKTTKKELKSIISNQETIDEELSLKNQESLITLNDLVENTSSIKQFEFDNGVDKYEILNRDKLMESNCGFDTFRKNKSRQKANNNILKQELISLDPIQETTNIAINEDHNFTLLDPNANNLLACQESGNTASHIVGSNVTADLKSGVKILTNKDLHTIDKNAMAQSRQPLQIVTSTNDYCAIIQNPDELAMEVESNRLVKPENEFPNYIFIDQLKPESTQIIQNVAKKPKVTILSEKTISNPVLIQGQLEPVSPSMFIHMPKKTTVKSVSDSKMKQESNSVMEDMKIKENIPIVKDVMQQIDNKNTPNIIKNQVMLKPFVVKHKIAPERVAAIEKKRNFNKKLRDIIEICLDNLDDQDKASEESKVNPKGRHLKDKVNSLKQNMVTHLSKQPELPTPQEYMMNFLEARMKKMEDTLLDKIHQNSQRIVDLKNSIPQLPHASKASGTQTSNNQESHKKQLYNEISQYLSPSTNSLIYEELFINKFSHKLSNQPSAPKRRKRR